MNTMTSTRDAGSWRVQRNVTVPALAHPYDAKAMESALRELPGMEQVDADIGSKRLRVTYDARTLSYQTIVDALQEIGFPPSNSWWCRLKAGWYQYTDANVKDNAKAPPSACCNKPPRMRS